MSSLATYDPRLFDSLPSFDAAQSNLEQGESAIAELAGTISRFDGDDHVGLALLHRHFELDPDELLVEQVFAETRESVGTARRSGSEGTVAPHLFRACRDGDSYSWYPIEFVALPGATTLASHDWLEAQGELLYAVAAQLDEAGLLDVFGLSLDHGRGEIECAPDEVLVEMTDEQRRVLRMRPHKLDAITLTSTPTNWSVSDGGVRMRCTCQRDQSGSHQHFGTN